MQNYDEDNAIYRLTPWGCLYCVLDNYGIDVNGIDGVTGEHIIQDFMDSMVEHGHIQKRDDDRRRSLIKRIVDKFLNKRANEN